MKDEDMTREQLITELNRLRLRNQELELAPNGYKHFAAGCEGPSSDRCLSTCGDVWHSCPPDAETKARFPANYKLSDLIDINLLQQLFISFSNATGIPHGILDIDNNLLSRQGWQDICTRFHRACPATEQRCRQSDFYIESHLHDQPFIGYHCLNGLMDYAAPITVEGQHLATIFYGQLLHEPPDEEFFRRQAHTYGFDEEAYLEALRRVPIVPKEQIESIMTFYSHLGQVLATIGLERKLQLESANRAIREREERLQLVWETSEDGFWDWNVETGDIYVSRHWRDILGYSKGDCEVNIDTWKRLVHPEDIPAVTEVLAEHLQGHSAQYGAEFRMLTRSGEWKWIMGRGRVVARDNKGRALRMVGSCIDLTIIKQAEAALLKSEEKFSRAFQINPDVMTIISLQEGRYVEVNDSFVKITGYEREEVIGRTVEELGLWVYPRERSRFLTLLLKQGSVRSFELEVKTKSGEIRTLCLSGEIMDINGRAHLLSSSRDITESKQMEAALRFSEECLSKAFNASPVLMAITQMEDGRYVNANEAFCSILGFERSEVAGISSIEIGFWANPADRDLVVEKLLQKQSIRDMEIRFCRKNGEQRLGLYSAEGIDVNGIPCILSVLADITDLRKMEAEMTRLDRLNLVGQMAASIGHEIRNPMTTVRGYLQMMRKNKNYQPELDYFDLMIEEIDRANSIITDFLSLAKNKMVDLELKNLNSIISQLLPLIQAKALGRDQHIKTELNTLPDLLLDKEEIRQLILNLINNGLESMPGAGNVTIKTFLEKASVVLAVQDEGQGIDSHWLDKLGTPFFTTKEQGTGLGLAVCYRIAARHNATIDLKTGPGGTTFFVRFALSPADSMVV